MILADPQGKTPVPGIGGRATLDELFRRTAARRPDAIALIDPPNREAFTDGAPCRLTYAQADRTIAAIAGRLRRIGLPTDAIVGLQLANTVDSVLALLAVLRAGLIVMPMPLLWRHADAVNALGRVGANALIVHGRIGAADHAETALKVASEVFAIRFVCGFGPALPDGVITLDDLPGAGEIDPIPPLERERTPGPGSHIALITWDVSADGLVPVARNHSEVIAGGLATLLESRLEADPLILSTLTMSTFAGLAVSLVPWLLIGGTLALHHPFDPEVFDAQREALRPSTVVVPGPLVAQFAEADQFDAADGIRRVLGLWRAPERLPRARIWRDGAASLIDVQAFGETGLIATRRGPNGMPVAIPFGPISAPRGSPGALIVGEVRRTPQGTVGLRGAMVPRCAFPPGAERSSLPAFKVMPDGFADTGYTCRIGQGMLMSVSGPPPGLISVGGYRFVARSLQDAVGKVASGGTLAALPDALAGHRLAGTAADHEHIQEALIRSGVNPLLVGAFRDGRRSAA
jgi:hypothetical protein